MGSCNTCKFWVGGAIDPVPTFGVDDAVERLGELLDKTAFHSPSETRRGHYERLARAAISALRKTDHGRYVDQEIEK